MLLLKTGKWVNHLLMAFAIIEWWTPFFYHFRKSTRNGRAVDNRAERPHYQMADQVSQRSHFVDSNIGFHGTIGQTGFSVGGAADSAPTGDCPSYQ